MKTKRKVGSIIMEFKTSKYSLEDNKLLIEVSVKGNADNEGELIVEAAKYLMSHIDVKHVCNEDRNKFNEYIDELLMSIADVVGYEHYYWAHVPESELKYNENDEMKVSRREKIKLLTMLVDDL